MNENETEETTEEKADAEIRRATWQSLGNGSYKAPKHQGQS